MPLSGFVTMFGSTKKEAQRVLKEIELYKVGDVMVDSTFQITITNRRMYRNGIDVKANKNGHSSIPNGNGEHQSQKNASLLVVEENIKEVKKEQKKKRVEGSRIPDPFPLSDEMRDWAGRECPGLKVDLAHASFVEYWTNNTTAKAFKVNWMLTWQKGMKLALGWQRKDVAKLEVGAYTPTEFVSPPPCDICHEEFCFSLHEDVRRAS